MTLNAIDYEYALNFLVNELYMRARYRINKAASSAVALCYESQGSWPLINNNVSRKNRSCINMNFIKFKFCPVQKNGWRPAFNRYPTARYKQKLKSLMDIKGPPLFSSL